MNKQDQNTQTTILTIWISLFSSLGLYTFVAFNLLEFKDNPPADDPIVLYALGGAAIMAAIMSFVLPKIASSNESAANRFVSSIIKFALSETVGVMGFAAVMLTNTPQVIFYFIIPSAALFLIHNPFLQNSREGSRRRLR